MEDLPMGDLTLEEAAVLAEQWGGVGNDDNEDADAVRARELRHLNNMR